MDRRLERGVDSLLNRRRGRDKSFGYNVSYRMYRIIRNSAVLTLSHNPDCVSSVVRNYLVKRKRSHHVMLVSSLQTFNHRSVNIYDGLWFDGQWEVVVQYD